MHNETKVHQCDHDHDHDHHDHHHADTERGNLIHDSLAPSAKSDDKPVDKTRKRKWYDEYDLQIKGFVYGLVTCAYFFTVIVRLLIT
mgnify:CR=1 FL=1